MSATSSYTISLKGGFIRKEAVAAGAITPGHLIQFVGGSGATNSEVEAHQVAHGRARAAFAIENDLVGKGIADAYAQNDEVQYGLFEKGAEVYALLTTSQTIYPGDALVSTGDGTLMKAGTTAYDAEIVAFAMEAVTTTSATARIVVEIK